MTTPLQAPPYGRALSCTDSINHGRMVSGGVLLGEAAYRRLKTERGTLLDDPNYGLALSRWLNSDFTDNLIASIPGQVRAEIKKDKRIDTVEVVPTKIVHPDGSIELQLEIDGVGVNGETFELAVSIHDLTVEKLRLEGSS